MKKKPLLSIILLCLISVSCVSTNSTMLSSKSYAPVTPEEVSIYLDEEDIPGDFERIAIINAKGSSSMTTESQMYEAVRKEAAKLGANGVLHAKLDEPGTGAKIAGALLGTGTNRRGEMVAIFVHD